MMDRKILEKVRDEELAVIEQLKGREETMEGALQKELREVKEENQKLKTEVASLREELEQYRTWMQKHTEVINTMESIVEPDL